jgi:hypothetical protein
VVGVDGVWLSSVVVVGVDGAGRAGAKLDVGLRTAKECFYQTSAFIKLVLTKALKLVLLSNSYPFLPSTQGRTATNRWNLRKIGGVIAWRNKTCSPENFVEFWEGCIQLKD